MNATSTVTLASLTGAQLAEQLRAWGRPMTRCAAANGRLWLVGGVLEVHSDAHHALERVAIYGGARVTL